MAVRIAAHGSWLGAALGLALAAAAGAARAGDGALEIDAACAAAGCFPGDAPGFPVQITAPGSYRLTSNLSVTSGSTAIDIAADDVTLDLAGFEIVGPGSCTGSGTTLICNGHGPGSGIHVEVAATNPAIRNGGVRGFDTGLLVERNFNSLSRIERVRASENHAAGVDGGFAIQAIEGVFERNGGVGILADRLQLLRSVARGNGTDGALGNDTALAVESTAEGNSRFGFVLVKGAAVGNSARLNQSGLDGGVAYGENVLSGNTLSEVSGAAVEIGKNVCGTDATCP
jgi:hypothetical protein